jgi:8-oxo-dGTP diphosphatase
MSIKKFCYTCGSRLTRMFIAEEDKTRLFCPSCSKPIYENPVPSTAAVVLNDKGEILLVLRNKEPKVGEWCLPGGYMELGETPENCCLRELKEETGLEGEIEGWAGNILSKNIFYDSVIVMGYVVKNPRGELTANDDCSDSRFFNIKEMPPIAFDSHKTIIENALGISI